MAKPLYVSADKWRDGIKYLRGQGTGPTLTTKDQTALRAMLHGPFTKGMLEGEAQVALHNIMGWAKQKAKALNINEALKGMSQLSTSAAVKLLGGLTGQLEQQIRHVEGADTMLASEKAMTIVDVLQEIAAVRLATAALIANSKE